MAPSATEVEHINEIVAKLPDISIEHDVDDSVAFGTSHSLGATVTSSSLDD